MSTKEQDVLQVAEVFYQQRPDWITFFREVLGIDGIVRQKFSTPEEYTEFEKTPEYQKIQQMLADLQQRSGHPPPQQEPTTVITVRLPKSLHDRLRSEAHERRTSMNKLCIHKLLQDIDQLVQQEQQEREQREREEQERREAESENRQSGLPR